MQAIDINSLLSEKYLLWYNNVACNTYVTMFIEK